MGLRPLAASIGVSYQAIQKFQKTRVPAEQVLAISAATEWKVTPFELRPDLYPHPHDGLPPDMRENRLHGSHDEPVSAE